MVDVYQQQQMIANQRATMMQARQMNMAAAGYARYGDQIGAMAGSFPGGMSPADMPNPLAPGSVNAGTAGASMASAAGVAGVGMLGWASMVLGMQRMGTLSRGAVSVFDPFTMGLHGVTRGLRGSMRAYGMAPKHGFWNTIRALPNLYARGGFGALGRGVIGAGLGAAAWAAPSMALMGAAKWAGRQVAVGAGQYGFAASAVEAIRPHIGMGSGGGPELYGAVRDTMMDYAHKGPDRMARFQDSGQLLMAAGQSQEFRGTKTVKDFQGKFKKLLSEVKAVSSVLQTNLTDAYAQMRQMSGMGIYNRADQGKFLVGNQLRSLGTGISSEALTQVGLGGSQIASQFGQSRESGARAAIGLATSLAQGARSGLISGQRIQEITGMSLTQGSAALASRMHQAAPTAMQGELGQTVLAALTTRGGELDYERLAQFRAGSLDWKDLRKMARRNFMKKGFAATFSTRGSELTGKLMSAVGDQELVQRMGAVYGQQAGVDPITGMRALTGMSGEEAQMMKTLSLHKGELEREGMQSGRVAMMGQLREQARSSMMSPGRIMKRLEHSLIGPLEKKVQDFGANLNKKITKRINGYLDKVIGSQTQYISKEFDTVLNRALRGVGANDFYRGFQGMMSANPMLSVAGQTSMGASYKGRSAGGGGMLPMSFGTQLLGMNNMTPDQAGIYNDLTGTMGLPVSAEAGSMTGDLFAGTSTASALFTGGLGFGLSGGLGKLETLTPQFWEGAIGAGGDLGGGIGGAIGDYLGIGGMDTAGMRLGQAATLGYHPVWGRPTRAIMGGAGRALSNVTGRLGVTAVNMARPRALARMLQGKSPITMAQRMSPMLRGRGLTAGSGFKAMSHLIKNSALARGAGAGFKAGLALPGIGTALDIGKMGVQAGKGVLGVGRGMLGIAKGAARYGGPLATLGLSAVDTYGYYQQQQALNEFEGDTGVVQELMRNSGRRVEAADEGVSELMRMAGAEGKKSRIALRHAGTSDYLKYFAYSASMSIFEPIAPSGYRDQMMDLLDIAQPGDLRGHQMMTIDGNKYSVYGDVDEDFVSRQVRQRSRRSGKLRKTGGLSHGGMLTAGYNTMTQSAAEKMRKETGVQIFIPGETVFHGAGTDAVVGSEHHKALKRFTSYVTKANRGEAEKVENFMQIYPQAGLALKARIQGGDESAYEAYADLANLQFTVPGMSGTAETGPSGYRGKIPTSKKGRAEYEAALPGLFEALDASGIKKEDAVGRSGFLRKYALKKAVDAAIANTKIDPSMGLPGTQGSLADLAVSKSVEAMLDPKSGLTAAEYTKMVSSYGDEMLRVEGMHARGADPTSGLEQLIQQEALIAGATKEEYRRNRSIQNLARTTKAAEFYRAKDKWFGQATKIKKQWTQGEMGKVINYNLVSGSAAHTSLLGFMNNAADAIGRGSFHKGDEESAVGTSLESYSATVFDAINSATGIAELEAISRTIHQDKSGLMQDTFGSHVNARIAIEKGWDKRMKPREALANFESMTGISVWKDMEKWERDVIKKGGNLWTVQSRVRKQLMQAYRWDGTKEEQMDAATRASDAVMKAMAAQSKDEQKEAANNLLDITRKATRQPMGTMGASGEDASSVQLAQLVQFLEQSEGETQKLRELFGDGKATVQLGNTGELADAIAQRLPFPNTAPDDGEAGAAENKSTEAVQPKTKPASPSTGGFFGKVY